MKDNKVMHVTIKYVLMGNTRVCWNFFKFFKFLIFCRSYKTRLKRNPRYVYILLLPAGLSHFSYSIPCVPFPMLHSLCTISHTPFALSFPTLHSLCAISHTLFPVSHFPYTIPCVLFVVLNSLCTMPTDL